VSRKKGRDLSRKQPPPKKSAPAPVEQPRSGGLFVVKALVGPTVIGTGWGIMLVAYKTGAVIACIGFVLWTLEFIYEPFLVKAPYRIHIALVMVPIAAFGLFCINVLIVYSPLNAQSYAVSNSDYPPGTKIGKIAWNAHFTDLRVAVSNPTDEDYTQLDIAIQPDHWNYAADITTEGVDCKLISMDGNSVSLVENGKGGATKVTMHRIGDRVEPEDDAGDHFEKFIQSGGYRLACSKLPSKSTVEVVFAVVSQHPSLAKLSPPSPPPKDGLSATIAEFLPIDKFNFLGDRPSVKSVILRGRYYSGARSIAVDRTINVENGQMQ
jgi:hypothetical protein